jgi:8-oxo-dGTP diphosphatase
VRRDECFGDLSEQLHAFGAVRRDPRERVVSVAYYALVRSEKHLPAGASDASDARWFSAGKLPRLAFDHAEIVSTALSRLREKIRREPIGFELLPQKFTLSELQSLYEAILQTPLDKRNFRKKLLAMALLVPLAEKVAAGRHRPAQLFRFDPRKYRALTKRGFHFEI